MRGQPEAALWVAIATCDKDINQLKKLYLSKLPLAAIAYRVAIFTSICHLAMHLFVPIIIKLAK